MLLGSALSTGWSAAAIFLAATCASGIRPALAATSVSGGATIGVEHNSNPLEHSNDEAPPSAPGANTDRDDTSKRLTANVLAVTGDGPTRLQLQALFSHVDFDRFDSLDHDEHNVVGNLDWKPSQVFDASLQASESRVPVGLADIGGDQSTQQTTRRAQGTLRLRPTPSWQLGLTPGWSELETPLPGAPNFQLRENTRSASLDYIGAGRLVPGLLVIDLEGTYSGIDNATRYQQQTIQGTLNYLVTSFSSFSLSAGHTHRTTRLIIPTNDPLAPSLAGTQSTFSGRLTYQRQLSVKTGISVSAFREFQPYDAGVNTSVGTGVDAGVVWKTTAKLSATLDSRFVWSTINAVEVATTVGDRKDRERDYSMGVNYLVKRRVSLRTYLTRRIRDSTFSSARFNETIAGLQLTVTVN